MIDPRDHPTAKRSLPRKPAKPVIDLAPYVLSAGFQILFDESPSVRTAGPARVVRPGRRYTSRHRLGAYLTHPMHDRLVALDASEVLEVAELVDDTYDSLAALPEVEEP